MTQFLTSYPSESNRQTFEHASKPPARVRKKTSPRITLSLSEEEHAKLKSRSQGMAVSAYVREAIFGADISRCKRRSHVPVKDQAAMGKALGLLGQTRMAIT